MQMAVHLVVIQTQKCPMPQCIWFLLSASPLPCLDGCYCFYSLQYEANTVNCSHNNMTKFPNKVLPNTETFIMTGNYIKELECADPNPYRQVKQFDFHGNKIHKINDKVYEEIFPSANSVKLSNNNLKHVSPLIQKVEMNAKLWLGNNPFECNCDMMWMRDWLQNATNVLDRENITCGPEKWKGKQHHAHPFSIF